MEDMAPALIADVTAEFRRLYDASEKIRVLLGKVREGTATFAEAQQYSLEVSRLIGAAYEKHISSAVLPDGRMYFNIASRLIPSTLDDNYRFVSDYAVEVQKKLNEKAGIGLRAKAAEKDADRIEGLVNMASSAERYDDVSEKLLTAFENFSKSIVDKTIEANADFQYRAGLHPKIIRKAERKCCQWCSNLAGEYDYPMDMPEDVFRRHENCRCTVLFDPADGKKRRQDVHTKRWTDEENYGKLEERKKAGLKSLVYDLSRHPKRIASFTPEKIVEELEKEGFEIKPLKQGSLKNVPFKEGGGFKVNFEDGGLFQYHPADKSHHGGAYYKISTGKEGTKRYDTDGNEIKTAGKK